MGLFWDYDKQNKSNNCLSPEAFENKRLLNERVQIMNAFKRAKTTKWLKIAQGRAKKFNSHLANDSTPPWKRKFRQPERIKI